MLTTGNFLKGLFYRLRYWYKLHLEQTSYNMKRDKGILFLCERKLIFITKALYSLDFALG